jgi:membrane-bound lytic murein transglycosylase B
MAQRAHLPRAWVRQTIGRAHRLDAVVQLIQPAPVGTAKNWQRYRSRFIEPQRIQAGLAFWQANRAILARAEQSTGVPAAIVVGVLGVETMYGRHMGRFRVLDALATLAFDFPASHPRAQARSAYFLAELEQFLHLTRQLRTDPTHLRGSYAGAMGLPQFMPSSWGQFALDFDADGRIDLYRSLPDVIGSVANYLQAFNWQRDLPTHYPVRLDATPAQLETLLVPDIVPSFDVGSFTALGAQLEGAALAYGGSLALIKLENGDAPPSYLAGTHNFYALTRYNASSYYALAVIELGEAVRQALSEEGQRALP